MAKNVGLEIPRTIVTNKKIDLLKFYNENAPIVSKHLVSNPRLNSKTHFYSAALSFIVKKEEIGLLADNFACSLFQKYIEKKWCPLCLAICLILIIEIVYLAYIII